MIDKDIILYGKLPKKELIFSDWLIEQHPNLVERFKRVLCFNPSDIYNRIQIDPFKRIHSIPIQQFFPITEGVCACGCGNKLEGRRTRWATDDCGQFAWNVRAIICNTHQRPGFFIEKYHATKACISCGDVSCDTELDHIIPIKFGGGGCWLGNYQYLCKPCHRDKTNSDFGFKKNDNNQTKIEFK